MNKETIDGIVTNSNHIQSWYVSFDEQIMNTPEWRDDTWRQINTATEMFETAIEEIDAFIESDNEKLMRAIECTMLSGLSIVRMLQGLGELSEWGCVREKVDHVHEECCKLYTWAYHMFTSMLKDSSVLTLEEMQTTTETGEGGATKVAVFAGLMRQITTAFAEVEQRHEYVLEQPHFRESDLDDLESLASWLADGKGDDVLVDVSPNIDRIRKAIDRHISS